MEPGLVPSARVVPLAPKGLVILSPETSTRPWIRASSECTAWTTAETWVRRLNGSVSLEGTSSRSLAGT